jgi:magnesium transporter
MSKNHIFHEIEEHIDDITEKTTKGIKLYSSLIALHHADIAQFLTNCSASVFKKLFSRFDSVLQLKIFEHLPSSRQAVAMKIVDDKQRVIFLENMSIDELYDLGDFTSDENLKEYFKLLRKKDREKLVHLLELNENTIGTIMDINVVSLHDHITVERSIHILQRLRPEQELHRIIYITDKHNKLVGQIALEDLVLKKPTTTIKEFMRPNEFILHAHEDQDDVAKKMRHYQITMAPVVSQQNYFVGAITAENLVDILEEESSEDILRISAMTGLKHTYFETPFMRLLFERGAILIVLMLAESFTSLIIGHYEPILIGALMLFTAMLISTGGNTSTQTSAVVVQGLASGEINNSNIKRFLKREFLMALCLALVLGITAFLRVYYLSGQPVIISTAVAISISMVAAASVLLGSAVPFILRKIGLDPAFAAAPFLATGMDILGLFLYCFISKLILGL